MMGTPDQLDIVKGDISSKSQLKQSIDGSDIVINFVGILFESGTQTFEKCHSIGPKNIAEICTEYQVKQFIHFSSIGADKNSDSKYQVSKALGEEYIREILPSATILRPSIVFGPGDGFFTVQSKLVKSIETITNDASTSTDSTGATTITYSDWQTVYQGGGNETRVKTTSVANLRTTVTTRCTNTRTTLLNGTYTDGPQTCSVVNTTTSDLDPTITTDTETREGDNPVLSLIHI